MALIGIWLLLKTVSKIDDPISTDLAGLMHRQMQFSIHTFGPIDRQKDIVDHIQKELKEVEAAPHDLEVWIDVALLALDGAWRAGYSPEEVAESHLFQKYVALILINYRRKSLICRSQCRINFQ